MAELNEIKTELTSILSETEDIGSVYPRYLASYVLSDFISHFTDEEGQVNVLMFNPVKRTAERSESRGSIVKRKFAFDFYLSRSDEDNSSDRFDNICENVCRKINSEKTLRGKIAKHEGMQMVRAVDIKFGSVLCHFARFELTTYETEF